MNDDSGTPKKFSDTEWLGRPGICPRQSRFPEYKRMCCDHGIAPEVLASHRLSSALLASGARLVHQNP
jgi:hypothetical protein